MIRLYRCLFVDSRYWWNGILGDTCRFLNRRCSVMLKFLCLIDRFDHFWWLDRACSWTEAFLLVVESFGEVHFLALKTTKLIRTEITLIVVETRVLFLFAVGKIQVFDTFLRITINSSAMIFARKRLTTFSNDITSNVMYDNVIVRRLLIEWFDWRWIQLNDTWNRRTRTGTRWTCHRGWSRRDL